MSSKQTHKIVSVYIPQLLYEKMQSAKTAKGFKSNSGFLVYLLRNHLEDNGYLTREGFKNYIQSPTPKVKT